ncbi:MAG: hypothetical protein KC731_05050 [Myxococcales bacterium]|nr:hypothetical protein [Myxococcales bacterium]
MKATRLKLYGSVALALGFLFGSYFAVEQSHAVSWTRYGIAFVVTAVGAVLLRVAQSRSGGEEHKVAADITTIGRTLDTLVTRVSAMNASKTEADVFGVSQRIDDECVDTINEFVEAREALIHRHGLELYAELMNEFARGERALNRAWCASADGYVDEVNLCLERAESHLTAARAVFQRVASPDRHAT